MNGKIAKRIRKATKQYMKIRGIDPGQKYKNHRGEEFLVEKTLQHRAKRSYMAGDLQLRKRKVEVPSVRPSES